MAWVPAASGLCCLEYSESPAWFSLPPVSTVVISYSVSRRTREIGIRIALGSRSDAVAFSVLTRCLLTSGSGVVIGLAISWSASPLFAGLLAETSPRDRNVRLIAVAMVMGTALLAGLVPAIRAAAVDPVAVLHSE